MYGLVDVINLFLAVGCRKPLCGGVNDINVEMPIQEVCDYT